MSGLKSMLESRAGNMVGGVVSGFGLSCEVEFGSGECVVDLMPSVRGKPIPLFVESFIKSDKVFEELKSFTVESDFLKFVESSGFGERFVAALSDCFEELEFLVKRELESKFEVFYEELFAFALESADDFNEAAFALDDLCLDNVRVFFGEREKVFDFALSQLFFVFDRIFK